MTAFFALMLDHEKSTHTFKYKITNLEVKASLVKAMMDPETCRCHLTSVDSPVDPTSDLLVDTTSPDEIKFRAIHEVQWDSVNLCSFSSKIIEVDEMVAGQNTLSEGRALIPEEITVSNIVPVGVGDRYSGNLVVQYKRISGQPVFEPLSIPLIFIVDPHDPADTLSDPTARPIKACWGVERVFEDEEDCLTTDYLDGIDEHRQNGRTLVGCGGTSEIGVARTTAYGFEAGIDTGGKGSYLGYQAGKNHTGTKGMFIGYQAGKFAGASDSSVFAGYQAGKCSTGHRQVLVGSCAGFDEGSMCDNDSTNDYDYPVNSSVNPEDVNCLVVRNGSDNVFIGRKAGNGSKGGEKNVVIGHKAGLLGNFGDENIFVGAFAGQGAVGNVGAKENIYMGYRAGLTAKGNQNIFLGRETGRGFTGSAGDNENNIFIGRGLASQSTSEGEYNIIIGTHPAGRYSHSGNRNVFLGYNVSPGNTGPRNIYVGYKVAPMSVDAENNTIIGSHAAKQLVGSTSPQASNNIFMGAMAGSSYTTGEGNIALGYEASKDVPNGNGDIFIGYQSGDGGTYTASNNFVVGNNYIYGKIGAGGYIIQINGQAVDGLPSSRTLKKNIKPVTNFSRYLESVLKVPLFIYQYNTTEDHPEKVRMGVIAEELPEKLRIQPKGKLAHPDWVSMYGYIWAGIKYLHEIWVNFKNNVSIKITFLEDYIKKYEDKKAQSLAGLLTVKKQILEVKQTLKKASKDLDEARRDLRYLKKEQSAQFERKNLYSYNVSQNSKRDSKWE